MRCPMCGNEMSAGYLYADVLRGVRFKAGASRSVKAEILHGSGVDAHRCNVCGAALVMGCPL